MYKAHKSTDILMTFKAVDVDLLAFTSLYAHLIDGSGNVIKKSSTIVEEGYDSDIIIVDAETFQLRVHREETPEWLLGYYALQVFSRLPDANFLDNVKLGSDASRVLKLVDDSESTETCEYLEVCLPIDGGGIPEAPIDGKTYGRKDACWVEVVGGGTDVHNDLTGRDVADAHPQSAITGLDTRLTGIETEVGENTTDRHTHSNKGAIDKVKDTGTDDKFLTEAGNYVDPPQPVDEFIDLNDTPNTYTGHAGRSVVVNDTEDGVDFVDDIEIGSIEVNYRFDTDTDSSDPTSGRLKVNNGDYLLATEMYINEIDRNGTQRDGMLSALNAGDVVVFRDNNSVDKFFTAIVLAQGVDNGTWWTIPIEVKKKGITNFNNGERGKFGAIYLGTKNFIGLLDTPNVYTGQAGKVSAVTGAEDGLEFVDVVKPDVTGTASTANGIWTGTQAEYDALGTYSDTTLYFIV